ncbi:hypothetical protein DL96DRAFT_1725165 [Flagelloscypha sp. PMI_526]|nr:hypothetical protein DL96DRAFT_1725165 [Flagelloscypha sp. PMI_526]
MTYLTLLPNLIANSIVGTASATTSSSPARISQNPFSSRPGVFNVLTNRNTRLPSPIAKLPVELLGEIFTLASGPIDSMKEKDGPLHRVRYYTSFHAGSSPMNLTHVSRLWRFVAEGLPWIWATLLLSGCLSYHPSILAQWLERSRHTPLTISLTTECCTCQYHCNCRASRLYQENTRVYDLTNTLVQHASRWQNVAFEFAMHHETPILSLRPGCLPLLRRASFVDSSSRSVTLSPSESLCVRSHKSAFWNAADFAPNLRHLSIDKYVPLLTQWSNIQTLHVYSAPDLNFLESCTSLSSLVLAGVHAAQDPVLIPNLKHLDTSGYPLDSLNLPSLTSLLVTFGMRAIEENRLHRFLERSGARLQTLTLEMFVTWLCGGENITGSATNAKPLIILLSSPPFQFLTSLVLARGFAPPSLIWAIRDTDILPSLLSFTFRCSLHISDSTLAVLAQRRRSGFPDGGVLQKLELISYGTSKDVDHTSASTIFPLLLSTQGQSFTVIIRFYHSKE